MSAATLSDTKKLLFKSIRVLDPGANRDEVCDVLLSEGLIEGVEAAGAIDASADDCKVVRGEGLWLTPGLIDIHVHFREPGQEWKETIKTGSEAAVAGGFTTVCCMPNTTPINDHSGVTTQIVDRAREANLCKVHPIGAISIKSKGEALAPMLELYEAGCVAFSDDGWPVWNSGLMRKALEYSRMIGGVLTVHEEDTSLSNGFSMNESVHSLALGLRGMPEAAENVMIARDIELARLTGGRVHFCHLSTARGAQLVKRAKEDGIPVTAEVMPHNLLLDDSMIGEYDTNFKMSMPLRKSQDVEGLREALVQGVIDCVASDHAPHEADSKKREFDTASFGVIGLQTTLPLILGLVRDGVLSEKRAIEVMTSDARRCLGLKSHKVTAGQVADLTIIDPTRDFTLNEETNRSKSSNSPWWGAELKGSAVGTIVNGRLVYGQRGSVFEGMDS